MLETGGWKRMTFPYGVLEKEVPPVEPLILDIMPVLNFAMTKKFQVIIIILNFVLTPLIPLSTGRDGETQNKLINVICKHLVQYLFII
jgi:hypothetical protein